MTGVVVPRGSIYFNNSSGLAEPGGVLDRLTQAMDAKALNDSTLRGVGPMANAFGVPVSAPPSGGILGQALSMFGLGGQPQPQTPTATSSPAGGSGMPAPTMAAPNFGAGGGPQPMSYAPTGGGTAAGDALIPAISQLAQKHGLDPLTTIRAVRAESGANPGAVGDNGSSFGLLQLHYGGMAPGGNSGAGMGDDYTAATGRDARDPANAMDALDYALGRVSKEGWGAFHGAAKAGIGQWDGVGGGAPAQMAAYAPTDSTLSPAARGGATGANDAPMPIARADPTTPQTQQSSMPQGPGGLGGGSSSAPGTPTGQVLAPLMANAQTRSVVGPVWKGALQQGGMPSTLALPGGMSGQALAAMITEPATREMGIGILTRAMFPQIQAFKPGDFLTRGGQAMGQVPSPYQHVESGRNIYGDPTYGNFNPQTGVTTPDAQPSQGGTGAYPPPSYGGGGGSQGQGPQPNAQGQGSGGTNEAFLSTLPPPLAATVKAVAESRLKMPPVSSRSPMAARMPSLVLAYKPDYDQTTSDARFDTRANFTNGDAAKAINSGNTAIQHAADLGDAAEALGNSNYPLVNKLLQAYGSQTGGNIPGKEFQGALNDFTSEVVKFYRSTGGTESDIDAVKQSLDPSQSPDQLRAGIQQQARLMAGKTNAYQNQWHTGMGANEPDFPIFSKDTQAALDRINARKPSVSSYPPRDAAGGGGGQSPLPTASPAGAIPTITDPAQARALPPGTRFRNPEGREFVR